MANPFVFIDGKESNRLIPEPRIFRRIRRAKEVWNAFKFLVRGGKFKVFLDFSGVDPRILKPVKVTVTNDGRVVNVENERRGAVACSIGKIFRDSGLTLASDDEPGFRVRWSEPAQGKAWEEVGFDVTREPIRVVVQPKGAA
ncbi:hypothetical protein [Solidesulfovibrio sp. C21]|uniref:hypothetical protein n=1 Tax=Solidesulfovibrio sp. C21 TaxID=3398613 RepID=UPI0039FC7644